MPRRPIGMFDSGVGGLTVMQQVSHALPRESMVYFGDTARVPYGGKSRETIIRYSIEGTIFLMEHDIKAMIIACNTASAYARDKLRQLFNIPIIDVIEPGAEKAVQVTQNGCIGVLGTRATIRSGMYEAEIKARLPSAQVISIPCPLFVPLVEEHFTQHEAARMIVREYLSPLKGTKVDTVLLGCTHYPLLRTIIEKELGESIQIVDPAIACAEKVSKLLQQKKMQTDSKHSTKRYFVSDDAAKFRQLGESFLGVSLEEVKQINSL